MRSFLSRCLAGLLLACLSAVAPAQSKLDNAQLDQLLAPIALYPDALLSQILMASTYPADVAAAAQWAQSNPGLSGDAAVKAVDEQEWDPSVKSLAAFPSVLDMMRREPKWVQSLGDTFLDQADQTMESVQRLRRQAQQAGMLKSSEHQTVTTQSSGGSTVVEIAPANPQVVYVPSYNPTVVYGAWPYPAYPPYYYPPPPGSVFASAVVAGIGFGIGVAVIDSLWGGFDWGRHDVNINVNRYNNIHVNNRLAVNQSRANWVHDPARRGATPYRNEATRQRYDAQRQVGMERRAAGPALSQRDEARDRAAQSVQQHTGQSIAGHEGAARSGDRRGQGGEGRESFNPSARQHQDRAAAQDRSRAMNNDSAFRDAGNGDRTRQQMQRPAAQKAGAGSGARGGAAAARGGARTGGAATGAGARTGAAADGGARASGGAAAAGGGGARTGGGARSGGGHVSGGLRR